MSEKLIELSGALAAISNSDFQTAITKLAELKTRFPDNHDIDYYLGVSYNHSDQFDEAIASFTIYLKAKPDAAGGHAGMGFAYFQKENFEKALECYERAKDLSPDVETLFYLAEIYFELGQYDTSISYYNVILTEKYGNIMNADESLLLGLAKNFIGLEKPKQALAMLEICEKYDIKSPLYLRLRGVALFMDQKWKEAMIYLESYLRVDPDAQEIKDLLTQAKKQLKD